MASKQVPTFEELFEELVVLDLSGPFVVLGRLVQRQGEFLVLQDADVHDLRDTQTTREKYVLASCGHGISPNRHWTWVSLREVVAISRMEDVIAE